MCAEDNGLNGLGRNLSLTDWPRYKLSLSYVIVILIMSQHLLSHMQIGKVWIYRLLFVCVCVCTVTDFSADDKASGVKFYKAVHRHPRQGISRFGEVCSHISPKLDESASAQTKDVHGIGGICQSGVAFYL